MNAYKLETALNEAMGREAKHERRDYLGMSGIGRCPREQYNRLVDPPPADPQLLWYSFTGYMHEAAVIDLLGAEQVRRELVADWDPRYRGHTDHEIDGTLVEVKSVYWEKFCGLVRNNAAKIEHVGQVQAYLKYSGLERAVIVYVVRNVPHRQFYNLIQKLPPFHCVDVLPNKPMQEELDRRARRILAAADGLRKPPMCSCGWCK